VLQTAYDVIGDIHGHADQLDALLRRLGYTQRGKLWVPPQGRQALFLGDLIDRGPQQLKVVETVRRMMDAGHALCIMGNHEFNAIGYVTPRQDGSGDFLRRHLDRNRRQHEQFLAQVGQGSALHLELVNWFRTLPPMLDLGGLRVVHAWWHQPYVDLVAQHWPAGQSMSDSLLHAAHRPQHPLWAAMEGLTKGLEVKLPDGHSFLDHGQVERQHVRTKWWHENPKSFRDVALVGEQAHRIPDLPLPPDFLGAPVTDAPVFVGHYWMSGPLELQTHKVACLDWSVAKGGPLLAYRWEGEAVLDERRLVGSH